MIAVHQGGPADGATVETKEDGEVRAPVRYYADPAVRRRRGWVELARYVFVPPQDGVLRRYAYTGIHQVQGPAKGGKTHPAWS